MNSQMKRVLLTPRQAAAVSGGGNFELSFESARFALALKPAASLNVTASVSSVVLPSVRVLQPSVGF